MTWTRALIGVVTIGLVFWAVVVFGDWVTSCPEPGPDGEVRRLAEGC